jgi:hypothetical protein
MIDAVGKLSPSRARRLSLDLVLGEAVQMADGARCWRGLRFE